MNKATAALAAVLLTSTPALAESWVADASTGCGIWSEEASSKDSATWSGNCVDGKASGNGTLEWFQDGKSVGTYEGDMRDGRLDGFGEIKLQAQSGKGVDRMTGTFAKGRPDGDVSYAGADGERFQGRLDDGVRDGFGRYLDKDGNLYEGDFRAGRAHGTGHFKTVDGTEYYGDFVDDKMEGVGILISGDGIYLGEFAADKANGSGVFDDPDGGRYHGQFKNGQPHGYGTYVSADDTVYQGRFVAGDPNGTFLVTAKGADKAVVEIWKNGEKVDD